VGSTIGAVHLRRALLLFAIVLGLAAVAASVSRTERNPGQRPTPPPPRTSTDTATPSTETTPTPAPDPGRKPLRFEQGGKRELRVLRVGQAATVLVEVDSAGQAELAGLGLSRSAEPATPASFEVFRTEPGSFPVLFHPAAGGEAERVGTLRVVRRATT
jgi:hypothetical protein